MRYFVSSSGNIFLGKPPGYLSYSSTATTYRELKRDLVGRRTVPKGKFEIFFAVEWGWHETTDILDDPLPPGTVTVQVYPLG